MSRLSLISSEREFPPEIGPACFSDTKLLDDMPVQNELKWADDFRQANKDKRSFMKLKSSPVLIPFKLCLAAQRKRSLKKQKNKNRSKCRVLRVSSPSVSKLERYAMNQQEYMNMLSTPRQKVNVCPKEQKKKKKVCCRCQIEPCPPRLVSLAVPDRRRVWENWKKYQMLLPTEVLVRFDKILRSGRNLEPHEARYYFKKLDMKKMKILRKKRKEHRRKKQQQCQLEQRWLQCEVEKTAEMIVEFFKNEPLFALNYEQLLLSDQLLTFGNKQCCIKKPKRTTVCPFQKTIVEIADKLAKWIFLQNEMVDMRPLTSQEELALEERLSLAGEAEGEEGEEGEGYVEKVQKLDKLGEEVEGIGEGEAQLFYGSKSDHEFTKKALFAHLGDGEDDFLKKMMDEDYLNKLIRILGMCPDEYLDSELDPTLWPGITNRDVLERLKELRDGLIKPGVRKTLRLEELMTEWALRCDPQEVDERILDKIQEVAALLADLLTSKRGASHIGVGGEGEDDDAERRRREEEERRRREEEERRRREEEERRRREEEERLRREEEERRRREEEERRRREEEERARLEELRRLAELERLNRLKKLLEEEGEEEMGEEYEEEEEFIPLKELTSSELLRMIRRHDPSRVYQHSPEFVCCLNVKIWAVWLLHVTINCLKWAKWILSVSQEIRDFAEIAAGRVMGSDGKCKKLKKAEWMDFCKKIGDKIVTWRQYCKHVRDLTNEIIPYFHNKPVRCCPQCRRNHNIPDVVQYHECCIALAEAIDCVGYWHRAIDKLVEDLGIMISFDELAKEFGMGMLKALSDAEAEEGEREITELNIRKLYLEAKQAKAIPCTSLTGKPCPLLSGRPCEWAGSSPLRKERESLPVMSGFRGPPAVSGLGRVYGPGMTSGIQFTSKPMSIAGPSSQRPYKLPCTPRQISSGLPCTPRQKPFGIPFMPRQGPSGLPYMPRIGAPLTAMASSSSESSTYELEELINRHHTS